MRALGIALCIAWLGLGLAACGASADDSGKPDPGPSWWPWVCSDGAPVPDGGCCSDPDAGDC
jgi:hypothetical protein